MKLPGYVGFACSCMRTQSSPCSLECDVYEFNVPFFLEVDKLILAVRLQEKHGRVANFPRSDFGSKNFMHRRVA